MWDLKPRRIADVVVASAALVVLSPVILPAIAIARLTIGQSGVFKQSRNGLNGEPFTMYKIRSLTDDETPTRFGDVIRRTAINELPQLVNVLNGSMSLIGPRPFHYIPKVSDWDKRYAVKPGITGLAQIREKFSGRQFTPDEHLKSDIEYIEKRNSSNTTKLDLQISLKTVAIILTARVDTQMEHHRKRPSHSARLGQSQL